MKSTHKRSSDYKKYPLNSSLSKKFRKPLNFRPHKQVAPLRQCEIHSQCVSFAPPREPLELSLLPVIVFHIALNCNRVFLETAFLYLVPTISQNLLDQSPLNFTYILSTYIIFVWTRTKAKCWFLFILQLFKWHRNPKNRNLIFKTALFLFLNFLFILVQMIVMNIYFKNLLNFCIR